MLLYYKVCVTLEEFTHSQLRINNYARFIVLHWGLIEMLRNFYTGKMISSFVVGIFILETDINKKNASDEEGVSCLSISMSWIMSTLKSYAQSARYFYYQKLH